MRRGKKVKTKTERKAKRLGLSSKVMSEDESAVCSKSGTVSKGTRVQAVAFVVYLVERTEHSTTERKSAGGAKGQPEHTLSCVDAGDGEKRQLTSIPKAPSRHGACHDSILKKLNFFHLSSFGHNRHPETSLSVTYLPFFFQTAISYFQLPKRYFNSFHQ